MAASEAPSNVERRAAFDIGSGSTKLLVADISGMSIASVLFGNEVPVPFAVDWKKSSDGTLSEDIQAQGLRVLQKLVEICEKHAVPAGSRCAIATEVFRKAGNGQEYLTRVHSELGLNIEMVSQDDEARLGFFTAVALQSRPAEEVVCWDSGGASFQITSQGVDSTSIRSYVGSLGTGTVFATLVEAVQGRSLATCQTPNPVTAEEAVQLVQQLRDSLAEPPTWLQGSSVTAIGGRNSMFCVASEALGGQTAYTEEDVRRALDEAAGLSDEDLASRPYCQGELREPPAFVVPKLCLLLAVVEHCGIASVQFCPAIGSCPGLLVSSGRFGQGE